MLQQNSQDEASAHNSFRGLRGQYVDSNTPRGRDCHSDVYLIPFPHPLSPNSQKGSRSMGRSPRSSPGDPGHLKGFGLDEGMPVLWPTSSRVQLQVSRPWPIITFQFGTVEQEYESKHQNLLAQQERRLQGAWRNVVVVFADTGSL